MPRKSTLPLEMVSVRLYKGDPQILASFYPDIGYNAAVRELVHRHCRLLLEKEARLAQPTVETANDRDPDDAIGDPITTLNSKAG